MAYEPRIIAYLCTWCSYTGADTAGIARLKSPANIRDIRVPCSGRVSPELVMRTFDQGADGVLILGCHIGECHYDSGNHRAAKRLPILRALMSYAGLEPERLRLDWVSASEGERFSRIATEFVDTVRALGPVEWRVPSEEVASYTQQFAAIRGEFPLFEHDCAAKTDAIRAKAKELLTSGAVGYVVGYEVGPRGRTRPSFANTPEEADKLVWNPECTYNLTTYLGKKRRPAVKGIEQPKPVAVVVKPCDSRAVNVLLTENQFTREQVHIIGVTCEGTQHDRGVLQARCQVCNDRVPVVYDTLIGEPPPLHEATPSPVAVKIGELENKAPAERMEFWLSQFERCIRCYACRQACPMCNCPVCLYERDDSLWIGMGVNMNEKRTFHLGRAYHLAGRCVGCNECERACPMNIPISLLNMKMAQEIETAFGHRAGMTPAPSPIVTVLSGEYKEG
ncbi:MAG: hydrogenase iron-sulfur subunit [Anaerolineales bacterium]|nr:hydrogenase iron-sulfur subunit [Anaerolineales bacterium]